MMISQFIIPTQNVPIDIELNAGDSIIFVGANGSGKTRLAVYIENILHDKAHRISAHRALELKTNVPKIPYQEASKKLTTGSTTKSSDINIRVITRWNRRQAVHLLNDFHFVVQALFADQTNTAVFTHNRARSKPLRPEEVEPTKFEILKKVWEELLPHRTLDITGDNIEAVTDKHQKYSASEMSDGERSIFYMLGQALVAPENIVLIIDEPELHIHPSIMGKLWDLIQKERSDCAFIFITHDLHFAANRIGKKYVIQSYSSQKENTWNIEEVPENSDFSEEITTLILGSRSDVLFVEGENTSWDIAIYRTCFPEYTVIPRGSCKNVIDSVTTLSKNASFTRIKCAGIVDRDSYSEDEIIRFKDLGVGILPVSEIENIVLLPEVSKEILILESYEGDDLERKLDDLHSAIISKISESFINKTVMLYCHRKIDAALKGIDFKEINNPKELDDKLKKKINEIEIIKIAESFRQEIITAMNEKDIPTLLKLIDGKGLFIDTASKFLKGNKVSDFKDWFLRTLSNGNAPKLVEAIQKKLPEIKPK